MTKNKLYLSTPEVFLNTVDQQISLQAVGLHPEWGSSIWFTIVERPSSIIDFFKSYNSK